jgi:predicted GNAT family acetyltransferase
MAGDEAISVADDPGAQRYVILVGGEPAGFAAYRRAPDRTVFTHTEIDDRFQHRGLGSHLVAGALDHERSQGRSIEPRCSFVARFIGDHAEYADLVPEQFRGLVRRAGER